MPSLDQEQLSMPSLSPDLPPCPFVGLVPFKESDYPYFFGRTLDIDVISSNLSAARLTVLYGSTGIGKTSVLQAGVVRKLRSASDNERAAGGPGFLILNFYNWSETSLSDALKALAKKAAKSGAHPPAIEPGEGLSLAETFKRWSEILECDILLILDQFEEFFLYHEHRAAEKGSFADQFSDLINSNDSRTHCLLSVREDALAKLDLFKGRIRHLLDNLLRLGLMGEHQAREAIVKPVIEYWRRAGKQVNDEPVERQLVDDVVAQLIALEEHAGLTSFGAGRVVENDDAPPPACKIELPFLQLVMSRLWEQALKDKTRVGKDTPATTTVKSITPFVLHARYLGELGGVRRIVTTHLDHILAGQRLGERRLSERLFRFLVTPSGSKIALSVEDLHGFTDKGALTERKANRLRRVLNKLCEKRILRRVPILGRSESRYEIFHDILGIAATAWRNKRLRRRRVVWLATIAGITTLVLVSGALRVESQRQQIKELERREAAQARLRQASSALDDALSPESSGGKAPLYQLGTEADKSHKSVLELCDRYLKALDGVLAVIRSDSDARAGAMERLASELVRLGDAARTSKVDGANGIVSGLYAKTISLEQSLPEASVSDDLRSTAGVAHQRLGDILFKNGDIEGAKKHFEDSLARDHSNAGLNLALDHLRLGKVAVREGNLAGAKEHMAKSVSLSQSRSSMEQDKERAERTLADGYEWLADMNMQEGDFVSAKANLDAENEIVRRGMQRSPDDKKMKTQYGFVQLWLGGFYLRTSDLDNAKRKREQSVEIFRELAADSTEGESKTNLSAALESLGTTLLVRREFADAKRALNESCEIYRSLVKAGVDSDAQEGLTDSLGDLADVYLRLQDLPAARSTVDEALALARQWSNSTDLSKRNTYRWELLRRARVALKEKDLANALNWCSEAAVAFPARAEGADLSSLAFKEDYAVVLGTMSKVRMLEKNFAKAQELALEARNLVPTQPWPQVLIAHCLLLSGNEGDAHILYKEVLNGVAYPYENQTIRNLIFSDFEDFRRFDLRSKAVDKIEHDLAEPMSIPVLR